MLNFIVKPESKVQVPKSCAIILPLVHIHKALEFYGMMTILVGSVGFWSGPKVDNSWFHKGVSLIDTYRAWHYCNQLSPSPQTLKTQPQPSPTQFKPKGTGADTKTLESTTRQTHPPITFEHEGGVPQKGLESKKISEWFPYLCPSKKNFRWTVRGRTLQEHCQTYLMHWCLHSGKTKYYCK